MEDEIRGAAQASARTLLSEQLLVADFSSHAEAACQKYQAQKNAACDCFARSFDVESSPAQRKKLLDQNESRDAYREVLMQNDFILRIARNCDHLPDLVSNAPSAPQMKEPSIQIALGRYVVRRESKYPHYAPYGGYCDIEKDRPNRFPVKCRVGGTFDGFGSVENGKFIVTFPNGVYRYQMNGDGSFVREWENSEWTETLTMQSETNRPETLSPIPQVRRIPAEEKTDRQSESRARWCAGLAKNVADLQARAAAVPPERARDARHLFNRVEALQQQFQEQCGT